MTHSRENGGLDSKPPVTPGYPCLNHTMLQAGAKGTDNDRNGDKDGMVVVITSEHEQLHGYKNGIRVRLRGKVRGGHFAGRHGTAVHILRVSPADWPGPNPHPQPNPGTGTWNRRLHDRHGFDIDNTHRN